MSHDFSKADGSSIETCTRVRFSSPCIQRPQRLRLPRATTLLPPPVSARPSSISVFHASLWTRTASCTAPCRQSSLRAKASSGTSTDRCGKWSVRTGRVSTPSPTLWSACPAWMSSKVLIAGVVAALPRTIHRAPVEPKGAESTTAKSQICWSDRLGAQRRRARNDAADRGDAAWICGCRQGGQRGQAASCWADSMRLGRGSRSVGRDYGLDGVIGCTRRNGE